MATRLHFAKYEGLGNDFVVVDGLEGLAPATVRSLCDRHFGIGADGVLLVSREPSARMIVLNADGSRPEMCGNGLRCVARYLATRAGKDETRVGIETDAGLLVCEVRGETVQTEMGTLKSLGPVGVPLADGVHRFARWSIGNPHAVTFEPHDDQTIDRVGPLVSRAPVFPEGTNVEFARLAGDGGIDLVVWERGVGRTLACGTGACATLGAACEHGDRPFDTWVEVRLPGGPLQVKVEQSTLRVEMRGPAKLVFEGEVLVP